MHCGSMEFEGVARSDRKDIHDLMVLRHIL
jgi:hypothetical protein